jgi:site-specific recombinase XerD
MMKKYGEEAGIPKEKRHSHVLKHSIATHLLDARADIMFGQGLAGPQEHSEHHCLFATD